MFISHCKTYSDDKQGRLGMSAEYHRTGTWGTQVYQSPKELFITGFLERGKKRDKSVHIRVFLSLKSKHSPTPRFPVAVLPSVIQAIQAAIRALADQSRGVISSIMRHGCEIKMIYQLTHYKACTSRSFWCCFYLGLYNFARVGFEPTN